MHWFIELIDEHANTVLNGNFVCHGFYTATGLSKWAQCTYFDLPVKKSGMKGESEKFNGGGLFFFFH